MNGYLFQNMPPFQIQKKINILWWQEKNKDAPKTIVQRIISMGPSSLVAITLVLGKKLRANEAK